VKTENQFGNIWDVSLIILLKEIKVLSGA